MKLEILVALLISLQSVFAADSSLALKIISDVCSADPGTINEFYMGIKTASTVHQKYPVNKVTSESLWSENRPLHEISLWYDGFNSDIDSHFDDLKEEYFEWCVHLYSPGNDSLYGCINGSERRGSHDFLKLGLLDDFEYNQAWKATIDISASEFTGVLQKALLSVTVSLPWVNHTSAVFYSLSISGGQPAHIVSFPRQEFAFLKLGERKIFDCEVFGTLSIPTFSWSRSGRDIVNVIDVNDINCTRLWGDFEEPCLNYSFPISYSETEVDIGSFSNCQPSDKFRTGIQTLSLAFNSPTLNDTGEYTCSATRNQSLFVSVVFIEFPSDVTVPTGNITDLRCAVKALSNATVYWEFNGQRINTSVQTPESRCVYTNTSRIENSDDNQFSIFQTNLQICNTSVKDVGTYTCTVGYRVPSLVALQTAQLHLDLAISYRRTVRGTTVPSLDNGQALTAGLIAGAVVVAIVITVIIVILVVVLWMRHVSIHKRRKSLKRRPSTRRLLLKPHLYKDEMYVDICSPDIQKVGEMEFPRQNLELQVELGRGKFGRVMKARAHGIVPDHPQINLVAVKTTITSGSFGENHRLLNELELMKQLYHQPHRNICNLLGYCTRGDPTYVILEYACHGSLKQYLVSCRTTVLKLGSDLLIDSFSELPPDTKSPHPEDFTSSFNNLQATPSTTNPLSIDIQLGDSKMDSKDVEKTPDQLEISVVPGVLKEKHLCNFAYQIASGLKHLANINIVHCDLAARNILIAQDGILKISDFGMAREVSGEKQPYQNVPLENTTEENIIPVKWAAVELLERQQHTFKSDIWSFGVIVWEIASYGGEPFTGFTLGASFDPFINYLKEGNRLEKPQGLSNYIYRRLCTCWSVEPDLRPTADDLVEFFQNMDPSKMALEDMLEEVMA